MFLKKTCILVTSMSLKNPVSSPAILLILLQLSSDDNRNNRNHHAEHSNGGVVCRWCNLFMISWFVTVYIGPLNCRYSDTEWNGLQAAAPGNSFLWHWHHGWDTEPHNPVICTGKISINEMVEKKSCAISQILENLLIVKIPRCLNTFLCISFSNITLLIPIK